MDGILRYIARNGFKDLIQHKADFDRHRELIAELRKRYPLESLASARSFVSNTFSKALAEAQIARSRFTSSRPLRAR